MTNEFVLVTCLGLVTLHTIASAGFWIKKTDVDPELVRQHHEKCMLLALIALAIMLK